MSAGIYLLKFNGTDKVYIGKSINLENRFGSHLAAMKNGSSPKKLLDAYVTYGEPEFHILQVCTEQDNINALEKTYIIEFDSVANGFNTSPGGDIGNISPGDLNGRSVATNSQYIDALRLLVTTTLSTREIAEKCNLTQSIVSHISSMDAHRWLAKEVPELYDKLLERKSFFGSRNKQIWDGKRKFTTIFSPDGVEYDITKYLLKDFCKEHSLTESKLSALLNGGTIQYKGWHTGKYTFAKKRPPTTVVDPHGNTHIVEYGKYSEFAKLHGMDPGAFRKVVSGSALSHHGWKRVE